MNILLVPTKIDLYLIPSWNRFFGESRIHQKPYKKTEEKKFLSPFKLNFPKSQSSDHEAANCWQSRPPAYFVKKKKN
jgi:hypothetical protein